MKFLKFALFALALVFFISACGKTETISNKAPENGKAPVTNASAQPTATIDELASAATVYKEKCVRCHKENGSGGKVEIEGETINPEDFTSDKMKKMEDEKYFKYIQNGVPGEGMPAFKDSLSEAEIRAVVKFIRREFQK